jgi:hypothetical protein
VAEYTPTVDFDFTSSTYTPTADFDFVTAVTYNLSFGQAWELSAPAIGDVALTQQWLLDALQTASLSASMRWALLTTTVRDVSPGFAWSQSAATFGNRTANFAYGLQVPAFADVSPSQSWALTIYDYADLPADNAWALNAIDAVDDLSFRQAWRLQATAVWTRVISATTYTLTLTGEADSTTDLTLPMASFSSRLRSGNTSYLQVSVPNARAYAAEIAARPNGELVVERGLRWSDGAVEVSEIARGTLSRIDIDTGARSSTASLQAGGTTTNSAPKTVALAGVSYKANSNGSRRVRSSIDNTLRPGDTATYDGETMVVGDLVHVVSSRQGYMELTEAT